MAIRSRPPPAGSTRSGSATCASARSPWGASAAAIATASSPRSRGRSMAGSAGGATSRRPSIPSDFRPTSTTTAWTRCRSSSRRCAPWRPMATPSWCAIGPGWPPSSGTSPASSSIRRPGCSGPTGRSPRTATRRRTARTRTATAWSPCSPRRSPRSRRGVCRTRLLATSPATTWGVSCASTSGCLPGAAFATPSAPTRRPARPMSGRSGPARSTAPSSCARPSRRSSARASATRSRCATRPARRRAQRCGSRATSCRTTRARRSGRASARSISSSCAR